MKITTELMIQAIAENSSNHLCKGLCQNILDGNTTVEIEKGRGHGSFISAVLDGDFKLALSRADTGNAKALMTLFNTTV